MQKETIQLIREAVHKPLKYDDYNTTMTCNSTNCYAHAIGSTVTKDKNAYRIGIMSECRKENEKISSLEEVKEFFYKDMELLQLNTEELNIGKNELLGRETLLLNEKQHIIVLFAQQINEKGPVSEFHFLRYDKNIGWTEKRWGFKPFKMDPSISWPDYWPNTQIGVFRITR